MAISKIEVDRTVCIGSADCTAIAPNTFQLDSEGISVVKNPTGEPPDKQLEAAKACPVKAIKVFDETGKQIWPEI